MWQDKIKKVVMSCLALFLLASLLRKTQDRFSKCGVILSGFSNCYAASCLKLNATPVSQVAVLQNLNQKMMIQCIFTVANVSCEIILASERCYLEINQQLFCFGLLSGLSDFQWHNYFFIILSQYCIDTINLRLFYVVTLCKVFPRYISCSVYVTELSFGKSCILFLQNVGVQITKELLLLGNLGVYNPHSELYFLAF